MRFAQKVCLLAALTLLHIQCVYAGTNNADKTVSIPTSKVQINQLPSKTTIAFDFDLPIAAASFIRANKLWVIFNEHYKFEYTQPFPLPSPSLIEKTKYWLKSIQQYKIDNKHSYIVLELADSTDKIPHVSVSSVNNKWIFEVSDAKPQEPVSEIAVSTAPLAKPFPVVELTVGKSAGIVEFTDPFIGDKLCVVASESADAAITKLHRFVDIEVIPSIQGAAIVKLSDKVQCKLNGLKVDIGFPNMTLSSFISTPATSSSASAFLRNLIHKDEAARSKILGLRSFETDNMDYRIYQIIQELQMYTGTLKAKVYANFALLYLANGFYKESRTILKLMNKLDKKLGQSYQMLFASAIAAFMDKDYNAAYNEISKIDTAKIPLDFRNEIRLWQGALGYISGNPENYFIPTQVGELFRDMKFSFLTDYTTPIIFKLGETIINAETTATRPKTVKEIFTSLVKIPNLPQQSLNRLNYLIGKYYINDGNEKLAIKHLNDCVADISDTENRTICRFELLKYQLKASQIASDKAIQELESLSYIWRGDQLEVNILNYLGDLYYKNSEPIKALNTWNKIVKYFPNSMDALLVRQKMSETFIKFFTENQDEKMKPLSVLALFYDYKDLVPFGSEGDEIIIKFTNYLIKMDLLDRAVTILNFQILNRFIGLRREEAINQLASLELMQHDPAAALETLKLADKNFPIPKYIAEDRKYIEAKALYMTRHYNSALALLKGDYSVEADSIQADIYWDKNNWAKFNDHSEPYLYSIVGENLPLTKDQVRRVLRQAVSYIMMDRRDLLDELYKNFSSRMPANTPYADVFQMLCNKLLSGSTQSGIIGPQDIAQYKAIVAGVVGQN